ncbi:methyl-accepting chemotaxis protein [Pseudoteredinibacter isoporae]|uniref:Methyl-accepting chemotaxis protein n=1 Tax=Pseudoteredinibacter isoporae TaxID=570281 RepID=A0A7X0JRY4_9GAMM|nr:methyl-accepting chemotaxis protein [Pseudoteredinibacter isoporae]MBB6520538.1 methyl-accepting chemotaxis protein [Pseudoteredinibacter isoporae]NHO86105.1 HAMP domain-containing protein [Pseudoteredinibacter isoporae]NIB25444.1 HAMP domain-containing protein [Pseudoteredinibacter isoporae]
MQANPLSLASKIYWALGLIAALLLTANIVVFYYDERSLAEGLVKDNMQTLASNYFDSVNAMMLTGSMANRKIIQDKLLQENDIVEARIIRGDKTREFYGDGFSDQRAIDEFERKALQGIAGFRMNEQGDQHVLEYIMPVKAMENYRGTNCLGCHQAKQGEVLGAVKISYDLGRVDGEIRRSVMLGAGAQLLLIIICFALLSLTFHRLVLRRLNRLKGTIRKVEEDMDLSREIKVHHDDELGAVSKALNAMMSKFKDSFLAVSDASDRLVDSATSLDKISSLTKEAVLSQKRGTDSVASAINELDASAHAVRSNTRDAAEKSEAANNSASESLTLVTKTRQGIFLLRDTVESNAGKIEELGKKTQEVGGVLDVITGIAEQTNLLALNAAIEAARAGPQGKGFAVVADEVRQLATRTRESIDQIQDTIEALQSDAKSAVKSMHDVRHQANEKASDVEAVADLLDGITEQIKVLDGLNIQIASATEQQNQAADEINQNVVSIAQVAEQSSEDAVRGKQISEGLLELAYNLNKLLQQFNLGK